MYFVALQRSESLADAAAGDSSKRENGSGISSQVQGKGEHSHSAGGHPAASGGNTPLTGSQHDPGFLKRLIAAQRERNSTWSSEDSSSSDDEANVGQKAVDFSRPKIQRNNRAADRKPENTQYSDGKRRDPAGAPKGSLDRHSAAPNEVTQSLKGSVTVPLAAAKPPALPPAPAVGAPSGSLSMGPAQEAARKRKEASKDMEVKPTSCLICLSACQISIQHGGSNSLKV